MLGLNAFGLNPGESRDDKRGHSLQFGRIVRANLNDHSLQVKASFITDEESDFIRVLFIRSYSLNAAHAHRNARRVACTRRTMCMFTT